MGEVVFVGEEGANLGGDLIAPGGFRYQTSIGECEVEAEFRFEGDRYVCKALTVTGGVVTPSLLRMVSLADWLRECLLNNVWHIDHEATKDGITPAKRVHVEPSIGSSGPTDDALQAVAAIYRVAYASGDAPTKAVAERLRLSDRTAARWVGLAREKGYLGPSAGKGKAGT